MLDHKIEQISSQALSKPTEGRPKSSPGCVLGAFGSQMAPRPAFLGAFGSQMAPRPAFCWIFEGFWMDFRWIFDGFSMDLFFDYPCIFNDFSMDFFFQLRCTPGEARWRDRSPAAHWIYIYYIYIYIEIYLFICFY